MIQVTSEAEVTTCLAEIEKRYKKLDVLVNCAGIGVAIQTFNFKKQKAHDLEEYKRVLSVNAVGAFNCARLAVGLMGKVGDSLISR